MKYLVKISNRALSHRFIFASLVSLNFVLLILLLAGSCKKEAPQANNILPLTIGDAKLIYATLHSDYAPSDAVQRDDSTEAGHNTPLVIPDWEKAETYLDEKRQISVVEVPVVTHHIAKLVIVEGTADSSAVDGTTQLNKLVFTQDTSGAIRFALMKLVGTPGYLATHDITLNSFRHLDLDFQGFLGYYNLRDSLLQAFLFNEQDIFEVQSQPGNPGNGVQNVQDRWGFCIDHYEYRPCSSNQEHTWEQRAQCKCGTEAAPNCTPPQRIPIYVICGVEVYLQGHIDEHGILPPRLPDNSLWITVGNGGGTVGGNTNQLSCLANAAKNFKDKYGLDLFSEAYEDILYGCMGNIDCHNLEQNQEFEKCIIEKILSDGHSSSDLKFGDIPTDLPLITDAIINGIINIDDGLKLFDVVVNLILTTSQTESLIEALNNDSSINVYSTALINFGFINDDPTNPPISATKMACPGVFNFKIIGQGTQRSADAVLTDAYFQFTYAGNPITFRSVGIHFHLEQLGTSNGSCLNNSANIAAGTLNSVFTITQNDINAFAPGLSPSALDVQIRRRIISNIISSFTAQLNSCNPNYGGFAELLTNPGATAHKWGITGTNCDVRMADCP